MSYLKSDFSEYSVGLASRSEADPLVFSHYLKRWPGVVVLTLGMWRGPFIVGVIVFALPPRETAKRYEVTCGPIGGPFRNDLQGGKLATGR